MYGILSNATVFVCIAVSLVAFALVIIFVLLVCLRLFKGFSLILGVLLGVAVGGLSAATLHIDALAAGESNEVQAVSFICFEDARKGDYGISFKGIVFDGSFTGSIANIDVKDSDTGSSRIPRCGDVVRTHCRFSVPSDGEWEYCWNNGIAVSVSLSEYDIESFSIPFCLPFAARNKIIDSIYATETELGDTGSWMREGLSVLAALVCGYRGMLSDSELYENYKIAGLAHLIAVSGAHLALVSSIIGEVLKILHVRRRFAVAFQSIFLVGYLLLSGIAVSAIRACAMALCCNMAGYAKRRPSSLNALGLCIMALVAMRPSTCISPSFVLSAGSTMGIILFSPLFAEILLNIIPFLPRYIADSLSLTLSAALCTQLYAASLFSQMSIVSPISNIIVAPLFSAACSIGLVMIILALLVPPLSFAAFMIAGLFCCAMNIPITLLSSVPFACIPFDISVYSALFMSVFACVMLWITWPTSKRSCIYVCAIPILIVASVGLCVCSFSFRDEVIVLDVAQGDAILVRSKGQTMMIDTGTEDSMLKEALARNHVFSIDTLFITHPDDDHCGSLETLVSVCKIGNVCVPEGCLSCDDDSCKNLKNRIAKSIGEKSLYGVLPGNVIECGSFDLTVLWPDSYKSEGGNSDSLCLLATYVGNADGKNERSILFCGDAESEVLNTLVQQKRIEGVDVIKVGHHGSKASLDTTSINALAPKIALISVGEDNRYGHPSNSVIDALESNGSTVFRTDLQGDLRCTFSYDSIEVSTLR